MHAPVAPIAYTPAEAATALGVTRQTVYNLIDRGELRRFKVGRCTRIPVADVHALVGGGHVD
jgi:excisionase family DNA binding protein